MNPAIETTNLTRDFGKLRAVNQLSLRVEAGRFNGFLGPNGAGKSTTINMFTGLLAPSAGTMKPTKMPGLAMLVMMLCHLLFPLAMAPAIVPPLADLLWQAAGWPNAVPVNLILSVTLAALAALAYWQALGPLGRLLQRRETRILAVVTVEVE